MSSEVQSDQKQHESYFKQHASTTANLKPVEEYADELIKTVQNENDWARKCPTRKEAYSYLGRIAGNLQIPPNVQEAAIQQALNGMYAYGKLQVLMDDAFVSDIQIYGGHGTFLSKKGTRNESTEGRMSDEELYKFISHQLTGTDYRFDFSNPRTDAILRSGSRLHVRGGASGWTTTDGDGNRIVRDSIIATIRKPLYAFSLEELQKLGMFSEEIMSFIEWSQRISDSFIIGGPTGSAKSSLMAAMMGKNPIDYMSCLMEEMPELQALGNRVARLWTRPANSEGKGAITMMDNLTDVLRMYFDNTYIGETRLPDIMYALLHVCMTVTYQTGTTLHVNNDADAKLLIRRIIALATASTEKPSDRLVADILCSTITNLFITKRTKYGIRLAEIVTLLPYDEDKQAIPYVTVAQWNSKNDTFEFKGITQEMVDRSEDAGYNLSTLRVQEDPPVQYVRIY